MERRNLWSIDCEPSLVRIIFYLPWRRKKQRVVSKSNIFITSRSQRNALVLLLCRFILVDPFAPMRFCFAIPTRRNIKVCFVYIQSVRNEQGRSRVAVKTVRKGRLYAHKRPLLVTTRTLFWHIDVQIRALPGFTSQQRISLVPARLVFLHSQHELMHDDGTVRPGSSFRTLANVPFGAHPDPIAIVQTLHLVHPIRVIVHLEPFIAVQFQTRPF